ncbi:MAG: site-specific integrase [Steroidobacter sp.]
MDKTVVPKFGNRQVQHLHIDELQAWLNGLVDDAIAKAKTKDKTQRAEKQRAAQATAHRTWNIFRAVLNYAKRTKRLQADAWQHVRSFRNFDAPRTRFLSVDESRRLLNACAPDFRLIAKGALVTGMRYGELCALKVADVTNGGVIVQASGAKNSRSRLVPLTDEGTEFFAQVCAGKLGDEHVFTQKNGAAWTHQLQKRRMNEACEAGKITPPATFHDLRRSYGSQLINSGMSLHMISRLLGHQSIEMTKRVYALLEEKTLRDALQKHAPKLGDGAGSNVAPISAARAKRPRRAHA